jgi:hypothetical protein
MPLLQRNFIICGLLVVSTMVGCAKGPNIEQATGDPFVVPKKYFKGAVKVIALTPITIPEGMPEPDFVTGKFDSLIEAALKDGGYAVVRPQDYETVWERATRGDLVKTTTGDRDPAKVAGAALQTFDTLDATFTVDAVLVTDIRVVEAPFASGRAVWDGVTQSINVGGYMNSFLAGSPEGKLGALSLVVQIYDPSLSVMYSKAGGIEVLSKMEGKEFVLVPRQELFTDKNRNRKAVDVALDPIMK